MNVCQSDSIMLDTLKSSLIDLVQFIHLRGPGDLEERPKPFDFEANELQSLEH